VSGILGSTTVFEIFAVCSPGIEKVLAQEISVLGYKNKTTPGGVIFKANLKGLYLTNLWLRTATRILIKIGSFKALNFKELIDKASRYPWEIYFSHTNSLKIRVTCKHSKLYHSKAVAERLLAAIKTRLGRELFLTNDKEAPLLVARLNHNEVLLRVDSSGKDLFKRGYKVAPGTAPLRENLAAALVLLSNWDKASPIIDPFCGTGTIIIEAAMIAANMAPGLNRSFAFQNWKNYQKDLFEALVEAAQKKISPPSSPIYGFDWSEKAILASQQNAKAAGVAPWTSFKKQEVKHLKPPAPKGFIVTNPPFGKRIRETLIPLRTLARKLQKDFFAWHLTFIYPSKKVPIAFPFELKVLTSFSHGGQRVYVFKK